MAALLSFALVHRNCFLTISYIRLVRNLNFSRNKVHLRAPNVRGINLVHQTSLNAEREAFLKFPENALHPILTTKSHTPNKYVSAHSQNVSNTEHKSFPSG